MGGKSSQGGTGARGPSRAQDSSVEMRAAADSAATSGAATSARHRQCHRILTRRGRSRGGVGGEGDCVQAGRTLAAL